jgi:beta-glucosidase
MGSIHLPWPARFRRGRPRGRRLRPAVLALAVTAALMGAAVTTHSAAYGATGAPFGGTPAAVPGTVYAANYDTGGQGTAYNVTSTNGSANSYRSDGVDLETTTDTSPTTAGGNGYDLGWTATGQWFNYTVNVATAGTYTVAIRLSSPYGITDALHIANSSGTNLSGAVAVPNTGGYQAWATVNATVTLPAGEQTLTVDQDDNGFNFHYMSFTLSSGGTGGDQPFGGTPAAVPGTAYAANYDTGGQGTAYNVTSTNGSANSYRSDGVDLETTWAGQPPGNGSSTPSTSPPPAPTPSACAWPHPPPSPTDCTSTTPPAPTCPAPSPYQRPAGTRTGRQSRQASPCRPASIPSLLTRTTAAGTSTT